MLLNRNAIFSKDIFIIEVAFSLTMRKCMYLYECTCLKVFIIELGPLENSSVK